MCDVGGGVLASTFDATLIVDPNIQHGTIDLSAYEANVNDVITIDVKPDAGYKLKDGSLKIKETGSTISNNSFTIAKIAKTESGDLPENTKSSHGKYGLEVKPGDHIRVSVDGEAKEARTNEYSYSLYYYKKYQAPYYAYRYNGDYAHSLGRIDESATYVLTTYSTPSVLTITAEFEPISVNYTVNHYVEQLDGTYKLVETETKTALTDSNVSINDVKKDIAGFLQNKLVNYIN